MKVPVLLLLPIIVAQGGIPMVMVGWEEARDHLITPVQVIRTNESRGSLQSVSVQLTVDATGQVVSAEALDSPQFADRAVTIAKALTFRPFRRNGVAVEVQIEEHVPILPLEKLPARHVVFPKVDDLSSLTFSLKRTECLGSCPIYEVRITGDGVVSYTGGGFVAVTGNHADHISTEKVQELIEAFRKADFFSFDDKYVFTAFDIPATVVEIKVGANAKTVVDLMGDQVGMPIAMSNLEERLDAISGDAKWLRGNSETVPSLRREGFDFKSEDAGQTLIRVAASGDEEAVLDLINAGAPIWSVAHRDDTALSNAASSGKLRAVDLLVQHGADPTSVWVLMQAARSGSPAVVRRILQAGADAKAILRAGADPKANLSGVRLLLFSVVSSRQRTGEDVDRGAVVRLLVEAGADPNVRDENYNIPLHGDLDPGAAKALIEAGADVNARNNQGATPLIWTSSEVIAEMLLNAGADPSIRSREGKTAAESEHGGHNAKIVEVISKASHAQK